MPKLPNSIQQQLIAARRNQILDAATEIFAQKGFHRARIQEIAKRAGVSNGTIYNYFNNKTDLLIGILDRLNETEQREEEFAQGLAGDFRSFLVAYLRQRVSLIWPNYEVFQAILPEIMVNEALRTLYYEQLVAPTMLIAEQYLQSLLDKGQLRPIDVPLTVRAMTSTVLGLLMLHILGDEEIQARWQELPDVIATMIVDGLEATI